MKQEFKELSKRNYKAVRGSVEDKVIGLSYVVENIFKNK